MKRLPKKGDELWLVDKKLVDKPVRVRVKEIYYNGNFASTIGILELPIEIKSRVWEVNKESLEKEIPAEPLPCFECEAGIYRAFKTDYEVCLPDKLVVKNVPMLKCDNCGDLVIDDDGNEFIDKQLNELQQNKQ